MYINNISGRALGGRMVRGSEAPALGRVTGAKNVVLFLQNKRTRARSMVAGYIAGSGVIMERV